MYNKNIVFRLWYDIRRHVIWFFQRRKYGFDSREMWSLDVSLAQYIAPRLKFFKDYMHMAFPGQMEVNFDICPTEEDNDDFEMLCEHWRNVLDIMINGFEIMGKETHITPVTDQEKADVEKCNRALCLFHKYYYSLWD